MHVFVNAFVNSFYPRHGYIRTVAEQEIVCLFPHLFKRITYYLTLIWCPLLLNKKVYEIA